MFGVKNIMNLLHEYKGDDAWSTFSSHFPDISDKDAKKISPDYEISRILFHKLGGIETASSWFNRRIPALGGKIPCKVLKNNENGTLIIRSLIMRLP